MVRCALFAALLAVCAWLSVPIGDIAFTMQTFGVFLALGLLGVTGGYIWGFLATGLVYWGLEKLNKPLAMGLGLAACYVCGCLWFSVYAGGAGFVGAVVKCVVPYLIPDLCKLVLAERLARRLKVSH